MLKRLLQEARDTAAKRLKFIEEKGLKADYEKAWGDLVKAVPAGHRAELLRLKSTLERDDLKTAESALKFGLDKFLKTVIRARYGNGTPPACEIRFRHMSFSAMVPDLPTDADGTEEIPTVGTRLMGIFRKCTKGKVPLREKVNPRP